MSIPASYDPLLQAPPSTNKHVEARTGVFYNATILNELQVQSIVGAQTPITDPAIYVDPTTGNDLSGTGTSALPLATFQAALDLLCSLAWDGDAEVRVVGTLTLPAGTDIVITQPPAGNPKSIVVTAATKTVRTYPWGSAVQDNWSPGNLTVKPTFTTVTLSGASLGVNSEVGTMYTTGSGSSVANRYTIYSNTANTVNLIGTSNAGSLGDTVSLTTWTDKVVFPAGANINVINPSRIALTFKEITLHFDGGKLRTSNIQDEIHFTQTHMRLTNDALQCCFVILACYAYTGDATAHDICSARTMVARMTRSYMHSVKFNQNDGEATNYDVNKSVFDGSAQNKFAGNGVASDCAFINTNSGANVRASNCQMSFKDCGFEANGAVDAFGVLEGSSVTLERCEFRGATNSAGVTVDNASARFIGSGTTWFSGNLRNVKVTNAGYAGVFAPTSEVVAATQTALHVSAYSTAAIDAGGTVMQGPAGVDFMLSGTAGGDWTDYTEDTTVTNGDCTVRIEAIA